MRLFLYIQMPDQQRRAGDGGSGHVSRVEKEVLLDFLNMEVHVYKTSNSVAEIIVLQNWERITKVCGLS